MATAMMQVETPRSRALVDGIAATLRGFERDADETMDFGPAARRLETFQRALAKALQAAHRETVQEFDVGGGG